MEYFSRMLKLASQQEGFRFYPRCAVQGISHLVFADDVLLLSRGDFTSVHCLPQQLTLFGQTSGLDINPQKSSIFFRGVGNIQKQSIGRCVLLAILLVALLALKPCRTLLLPQGTVRHL
jgi:hypothetical protein